MENGLEPSYFDEEVQEWETLQESSANCSEESSAESELSEESSSVYVLQETSSDYDLGNYENLNTGGVFMLLGAGLVAGFAVTMVITFVTYGAKVLITIFRKGV